MTDWPCEPVPALLPDIDDAVDAGAGFNYGCALHKSGTVSCWGDAASVGRGVGGPSDPTVEIVPSGLVTGLSDAVALRVGNGLTCALRSQKTVACWGAQLGFREPVEMPWAADAVTVGKYQPIGAALLPDGTARAWGQVSALGDGTLFTTAPIELGIPSNTVELALDGRSACAREQSGTVLCWGPNDTTLGVVDR